MTSLEEIISRKKDNGENWFYFSEYMIYSDMWSLRKKREDVYEIVNKSEVEQVLTSSLHEFLERFLNGNVFDKGGLYDWHEELNRICLTDNSI